jgi:hypothetical protein
MPALLLMLAFAAVHSIPSDAYIVESPDLGRAEPIGNVLVIFNDGHRERWTRHGGCMMPRVADGGLVGWVRARDSYPTIRVCWPDGHYKDIPEGNYPYLDTWCFVPGANAIAMEAGFAHGPRHFTECDVFTGKVLATATGPSIPAWATHVAD